MEKITKEEFVLSWVDWKIKWLIKSRTWNEFFGIAEFIKKTIERNDSFVDQRWNEFIKIRSDYCDAETDYNIDKIRKIVRLRIQDVEEMLLGFDY